MQDPRQTAAEVQRLSSARSSSIDRRKTTPKSAKIKEIPDSSFVLSNRLQARITTLSSPTTFPHLNRTYQYDDLVDILAKSDTGQKVEAKVTFSLNKNASYSLFKRIDRDSADTNLPVYLKPKKMRINPGIPIAEIHKDVSAYQKTFSNKDVVPPIKNLETECPKEENICIKVEREITKEESVKEEPFQTPFDFLDKIKKNPNTDEYVYMVTVTSSKKAQGIYNPYNLKLVNYFQIDTSSSVGYFTMSAKGVTHINNVGRGTFTPLNQWLREYELYHNLLEIPFFANYRKWKCFTLWKKIVLHTKIVNSKRNLENNLFVLHPILCPTLLEINKLNMDISLRSRLVNVPADTTLELADFVKDQKSFVEHITYNILKPWEQKIRQIVDEVSKSTLHASGFEIEMNSGTFIDGRKITFTEQAARRAECKRLTKFIKLTDYMIVSTLQMLVINSVQDLLKISFKGCQNDDVIIDESGVGTVVINEQGLVQSGVDIDESPESDGVLISKNSGVQVGGIVVGKEVTTSSIAHCGFEGFSDILSRQIMVNLPQFDMEEVYEEEGPQTDKKVSFVDYPELVVFSKKAEESSKWKQNDKPKSFVPVFRTELLMEQMKNDTRLYFNSSINDYLATIDILLKVYLSTIEQVGQLTNTFSYLESNNVAGSALTSIRGIDEIEFGDGPQVSLIVLEGSYFKELCGRIRGVFVGIFSNAAKWLTGLQPLKDMFVENQSFDILGNLKENVGELPYMLVTASDAERQGGVAGIVQAVHKKMLMSKFRKDTTEVEDEFKEQSFNLLSTGMTAYRNDDGLVQSRLGEFFDLTLKKFAQQKEVMAAMPTKSVINNLLVDTYNLKCILVPSPERCFDEVARILPGIARDKNELLLTEVQAWLRILNTQSSSVESFVEYLGWLDKSKL
jgi:dynein heavy chain